jgi:competence protein ComEA
MALYNRERLMVLCALLALVLCRAGWMALAPGETVSPQSPRKQYVYEVAGAVRSPGIYSYDSPQQIGQLLDAAGACTPLPEAAHRTRNVANGSRIVVEDQISVGAMSAQARLHCYLPVLLSTATAEELALIPGMGMITAQAIVDYRDRSGGIRDVGELKNVNGIGPKKLDRFAPYLTAEN